MSSESQAPDDLDVASLVEGVGTQRPSPYSASTDHVPFDNGALDAEMDFDFLSEKTADDIGKTTFRSIPPGEHTAMVLKIDWAGKAEDKSEPESYNVWTIRNGVIRSELFYSQSVNVVFCIPGDERCTIRDLFRLTPRNQSEKYAFEHGFGSEERAVLYLEAQEASKSTGMSGSMPDDGGFWAKKLRFFLGRLFESATDSENRFRPEVGVLRNWVFYPGTHVHRLIRFRVQAGQQKKPFYDPSTQQYITPKVYDQVAMHSYQYVAPPAEAVAAMSAAGTLTSARATPPPPPPQPESQAPTTNRARGRRANV